MKVFNLDHNILPASEVTDYKVLENDKFYEEIYSKTEVSIDYLNRQVVSMTFYLKNSYHKLLIAKIDYDYVKNEIIQSNCLYCDEHNQSKRFNRCYHVVYLLRCYNDGVIKGALCKQEIDMLFNNLLEKKRQEELEKIRKQNLHFLSILEDRLNRKDGSSSNKKASIIPNFECNSFNGFDYKTSVDIKIKVDKPYVVKDLQYFIYMVQRNIVNQYGKNFTFKHNINNFEDKSRKFVNILMNYCYDTS